MIKIATDLSASPLSPINQASDDWGATKAAYRFFENPKVNSEAILDSHIQNTIKRCQNYPFVLFLQDSSSFNFTHHPSKKDLGSLGTVKKNSKEGHAKGIFMHTSLAVSPVGLPLGIVNNYFWKRSFSPVSESTTKKYSNPEEVESTRWINSVHQCAELCKEKVKFISIGDRESDFNDYFLSFDGLQSHYLVRSKYDRVIQESSDNLHIFASKLPVVSEFEIEVNCKKEKFRSGDSKSRHKRVKDVESNSFTRKAKLKLQFAKVHALIHPEQKRGRREAIEMSVVRVFEEPNESGNYLPVNWVLLTSIDVNDVATAELMVSFYSMRWQIEVFFRTLKSGCRVEDCRLESYDKITNYIALNLVIAWRIHWMSLLNRFNGDQECTAFLSEIEWKALYVRTFKSKNLPQTPPTIKEAVLWIAKLGGFLGRKSDGNPGQITIWRGWQVLTEVALMQEILA